VLYKHQTQISIGPEISCVFTQCRVDYFWNVWLITDYTTKTVTSIAVMASYCDTMVL